MVDYKRELSSEQYDVVTTGKGPVLVIAGAGSGKTRTLTYRVSYLIEKGISPRNILLLTFTNKASREMLERVRGISGSRIKLQGGTFHHVASALLRRYASEINRTPQFTILDMEDNKMLLNKIMKEKEISKDTFFPKLNQLLSFLSLSVNTRNSLEEIFKEKAPHFLRVIGQIEDVVNSFEEKKEQTNSLNFDDLLSKFLYLLRNCSQVREKLQNTFQYILVDEFQDTNKLQNLILEELTKKVSNPNLMVVGDDAQSIYSFRGAEVSNILNFPKKYPDCKIFKLQTNYRSTKEILDSANDAISQNINQFPKHLRAKNEDKDSYPENKPYILKVPNEKAQAKRVAKIILNHQRNNSPLNEIAVLFRAGFQSMQIELELSKYNIPYIKRGGMRFFEGAHIKDVLSFLKIEENISDEASWRRVLLARPGIGIKTAEKIISQIQRTKTLDSDFRESFSPSVEKEINSINSIFAQLKEEKSVDQKIKRVLDSFYRDYVRENFENPEERIEDISALMSFAANKESLQEFLDEVQAEERFQSEARSSSGENLVLSTIHQAKGLEWKTVILIDVIENSIPNKKAIRQEGNKGLEEERRLFYVALTRAKENLYLFVPLSKKMFRGKEESTDISRFLAEMSEDSFKVEREFLGLGF